MFIKKIKNISIVGAGVIGYSIAQKFALEGFNVNLCDSSKINLLKAKANIINNLSGLSSAGLIKLSPSSVLSKIKYFEDVSEAVLDSKIVIEALTENLEIKKTY
nr:3-hydroxyacyl-CoA dehydrogenase NAD-binding domain-containing protein [Photobacterium leiognathi]